MEDVHCAVDGKITGIVEKQTRADPEGGLPAEVDGGSSLEQFPEIIDAGADDEQATQCIGHCVESVALDKENIDQGDNRVGEQKGIERLLCTPAMDDLVEYI